MNVMTQGATASPVPAQATGGSWPQLPPVPVSRARAAAARALIARMAARLPIRIELPGGDVLGAGSRSAPAAVVHRPAAFFARISSGTAGFAESYMAGDWDCADLPALFAVLTAHLPELVPGPLQRLRRLYIPGRRPEQEGTAEASRRNIESHYDLSNDFFELFLDPTLTYSSAFFGPGDTLAQAQGRKIDRMLDLTGTGPGTRLLEIGTGWGELTLRAARRGAHVTSLTISPAQRERAITRAAEAGLADHIDVQLRDYRDARGSYDAVVSIEMIEAVGAPYWDEYFGVIDAVLGPGGRAGIQAITMPHDRMLATLSGQTWIHKYIFPGGQVPSMRAITNSLAATSLQITSDLAMGTHYARTLAIWRERFRAAETDIAALGFNPQFRRMWNLYLAYAEAGFRAGYLDVHQLILERRR